MLQRVPKIIKKAREFAHQQWDAQRLSIPAVFVMPPDLLGYNKKGSDADFKMSARMGAPLPNVSIRSTAGYEELDPDMQKQLPWILLAVILVAFCCFSILCGLLVFCGFCTSCCPAKKRGLSWEPIDEPDEEAPEGCPCGLPLCKPLQEEDEEEAE